MGDGTTRYQLRRYTVKAAQMERWINEWRQHVYPLRLRYGFGVEGAWVNEDTSQFVWILSYDGDDDWSAAEERYYGSTERSAMDPDPARHLEAVETMLMRSALPTEGAGRH